jgi:hypothetical protein
MQVLHLLYGELVRRLVARPQSSLQMNVTTIIIIIIIISSSSSRSVVFKYGARRSCLLL